MNKLTKIEGLGIIMAGLLGFSVAWWSGNEAKQCPPTDVTILRNTFRAGAAFSELYHAETAHYPDEEKINAAIHAIENGKWKEFLDDLTGADSESAESRGRVFIVPEGQDSGPRL